MEPAVTQSRFKVCPSCGRLIPADAPRCAYCGARFEEVEEALREEGKERRFARALFARRTPFTYCFIGINLAVFVLMWLSGGMGAMSTDPEVLRGFGANEDDLIGNAGQYWRLVTSIFIHIGFLHLLFNNYALYAMGQQIELLYGSSRFVLLYLLTGMAGSAASYLFPPDVLSAGASGAIFGLFGVMATFAFRYRDEVPKAIQSSIRRQIFPVIVINLLFGFSVEFIDNAAHLGGLLSGVVLALVIPYKRVAERATAVIWRALLVVCLVVIGVSIAAAYRNYDGPRPRLANLTRTVKPSIPPILNEMLEGTNVFEASEKVVTQVIRDRERVNLIQVREAVERGIQKLETAGSSDQTAEPYRNQLLDLLRRQKDLIEKYSASARKDWEQLESEQARLSENYKEFLAAFERYLARRGLVIKKNDSER